MALCLTPDGTPPPMVERIATYTTRLPSARPPRAWVYAAVRDRLSLILPDRSDVPQDLDIDGIRRFVSALSPQWSVTSMRFYLNLWTTSHRMHIAEPEGCLFGCRGADNFRHYVVCPFLRNAIEALGAGVAAGGSVLR